MNITSITRRTAAFVCCLLIVTWSNAASILTGGMRGIEEFRMQQLSAVQSNAEISPFISDGCSGNLSKGWEQLAKVLPKFKTELGDKPPWEACCVTHDHEYWRGATGDGFNQRLIADQELRQCIVDTGIELAPELSAQFSKTEAQVEQAFSVVSDVMYQAVRFGGQPCSLLPWRWGFGWPSCAFTPVDDDPTIYSELSEDERIVFFNTSAWLDSDKSHWNIPIHAWVYEPTESVNRRAAFASLMESNYELRLTSDNEAIFDQRTNLLIADNERGKQLAIRIAGRDMLLPESTENGHVKTVLRIPASIVDAISEQNQLHYVALIAVPDNRRFEGHVQLVTSHGVSVISDIDDTVKITEVTNRKRMLDNTFYRDFREAPGMAEMYRKLADQDLHFHFVSSSPWQLYEPLQEFLASENFPWATLNLKAFRFRDTTLLNLFKKGTETKPAQIEPILKQYPQRKFILIGDSGEQDPEVYGDIARRYSLQVEKILIRNVDGSSSNDLRYQSAFEQIPRERWQLFDHPEQIFFDIF